MEKPIDIKDYALKQLLEEYDYYKKEYSLAYAEKFRKHFFAEIETISPTI